jgi:disease resistance protein RPS2
MSCEGQCPVQEVFEDKLYKPLKWSYDSLEGNNIKPCFLYCSLFPEDFSIENLYDAG